METESEKKSYDIKQAEEANDQNKTESYEPISEDSALLEKAEPEEKPTEAAETADETTALTEEKANVDPEDLTKKEPSSQTLKGRFLQMFDKKKPNNNAEPAVESHHNGDTPHTTQADPPQTTTKKRFLPPIKIKNPFMKKSESSTPIAPAENTENVDNPEPAETDKKDGVEATEVLAAENGEEKKEVEVNEEKPKITSRFTSALSSIALPTFSGLVSKFKRAPANSDIEMGNGKKAGLASMETLDDSTKDPWNTESDAVDASKSTADKPTDEKVDEVTEKGPTFWDSIRAYSCSLDDIALFLGLFVFLILVALILTFTFLGSSKPLKVAPIRDGKVVAMTSCGKVEGLVEDSAIAFRGIPYAQSPIGRRRFESARPLDNIKYCWNGTLNAHSPREECMQVNKEGKIEGSEDCLTLDILTKQVRNYNLLPVIVLIGSESYNGGSPGILTPSARYSRIRDVVYVRPKFRLNVFGFLALESLSKFERTSGNYALSDIIVALEWIQNNIHNFGGDPTSVILFGHRTGATLVTALTSSEKASKLFDRAWASSPSHVMPGISIYDLETQNAQYANNFRECSNKTCWQEQDPKTLINKIPESWKRTFADSLPKIGENYSSLHKFLGLDGVILKKHPNDVWKGMTNLASKLVIGTTKHAAYDKDESSTISSEGIFQLVNDSRIGEAGLTEEALKRYGSTVEGLKGMISDIRTVCPLLSLARSQNNIPFYVVTQTRGENKLADVSSDVEGILGRYTIEDSTQRRYVDSIRQLFFYYVYHGKVMGYSQHNFVLNVEQDVEAKSDYPNCDFWISKDFVPHYAAI